MGLLKDDAEIIATGKNEVAKLRGSSFESRTQEAVRQDAAAAADIAEEERGIAGEAPTVKAPSVKVGSSQQTKDILAKPDVIYGDAVIDDLNIGKEDREESVGGVVKVGDLTSFNHNDTEGSGFSAEVSEIVGLGVSNIETTLTRFNNAVFTWNSGDQVQVKGTKRMLANKKKTATWY